MSSFINSPEHFNSCEKSLANLLIFGKKHNLVWSMRETFPAMANPEHYGDAAVNKEVSGVFDTLRNLQVLCVNLQYRKDSEGKLDEVIESDIQDLMENKKQGQQLDRISLFKALQCIKYQIETEQLDGIRDLTRREQNAMKFIVTLINSLARDIVSCTDEYNKAQWAR